MQKLVHAQDPILADDMNDAFMSIRRSTSNPSTTLQPARVRTGCFSPSFCVSLTPMLKQNVAPGFIVVEGGMPFVPEPLDIIYGADFPGEKNIYLTVFTKKPGSENPSQDPSTNPILNPSYEPGGTMEASAQVTTEDDIPAERDGYFRTVILLSKWGKTEEQTQENPLQHWASDIFISSKGSLTPTNCIPVFVRSCPETGWGPDENRAHNGLEVKDESTPDKWQYAVALKHANESYSTEDIVPVDYQLGGVYKSYISGLDGAVAAQNKPTISYGQIIFPLANQGDTYLPSTYGLIYAACLVVDPESYSGSTYNEPRINKGVVEIPKGAGLEIGSENDPDRPPAYHYMTDAQLQTNGWIKVCSYGFNTGSETHDCYMAIRKGKLFFYMKPDGQISTEPS